jgi:hypothetical protein
MNRSLAIKYIEDEPKHRNDDDNANPITSSSSSSSSSCLNFPEVINFGTVETIDYYTKIGQSVHVVSYV